MAIDVKAETIIHCPKTDVAEYAFNPVNDPVWIGGINEANLLTGRPIGVGTKVQRIAGFMGKKIDYILEVIEFEEETLMVMESIKSPFPMKVTYKFDDADKGTQATIRVEGNSKGFYKLTDFLMAGKVKKNISEDLERLKKIMEEKNNE